jgi:hypothetical protein
MGFVYGAVLSGLAPLLYLLWLQQKKGFLIVRYELYKVLFLLVVAGLAYLSSTLLMNMLAVRHRI